MQLFGGAGGPVPHGDVGEVAAFYVGAPDFVDVGVDFGGDVFLSKTCGCQSLPSFPISNRQGETSNKEKVKLT